MKTFLLTIIIFNIYNLNTFAKHKFNPKIERESYVDCGWCGKKIGYCGSMNGCKMVYIYKFPKNIDKMIKENPEFKEEILGEGDDLKLSYSPKNKIHSNLEDDKEIVVKSCYDLWKNADLDLYGSTTLAMIALPFFEQECNKIVKKILKKTGKLY
jgi:hypothetical protein